MNPSKLKPLPVADWNVSLAPVINDMGGAPLNVHGLLAHQPELLRAWWSSRLYLVSGASLGQRWGELVILRVSVLTGSWYEWGAHVVRGLHCGLSQEEILCVMQGAESSLWNAADMAVLQAVDELFHHRQLRPAMQEALAAHLKTPQMLDLMALTHMYLFLADVLKTWPVELEEPVVGALPDGITAEQFGQSLADGSARKTERCCQQVQQQSDLRITALLAADWETVAALIHPQLRYIHSTGLQQGRSDYLACLPEGPDFLAIHKQDQQLDWLGNSVLLTAGMQMEIQRVSGERVTIRSHISELWVCEQDRWLLKQFQSTAIPTPR